MSDHTPFGFGKFIPGFDFLQNLSKSGQATPGMPSMSHWVAPTVSVEEISKRIEELKAVQFWLEQNSRALTATVQALEVQKMTLSTLQGMNVSMADLAKTFTGAATQGAQAMQATATEAASHAGWPMSSATKTKTPKNAAASADAAGAEAAFDAQKAAASEATPSAEKPADASSKAADSPKAASDSAAAAGLGDPMLWWGALTEQFQQIAATAMQDPAQQQAMSQATNMASDFTKAAMQAASTMVRQASEGVKSAASTAAQPAKSAKATAPQPATAGPAKPGAAPVKAAARKPAAKKAAAAPRAAAKKATPARKRGA